MYRNYAKSDDSVIVSENDVIVVWDGARCGLPGISQTEGALGSTLTKLSPIIINQKYLLFFLRTKYEQINTNPRGSGIPHVNPDIFWNLTFPLSPLAEQNRIVNKVDKLLTEVNKLNKKFNLISEKLFKSNQLFIDWIVQGKFSQNNNYDFDARILMSKIEHKKAELIKEKIIRKEKKLDAIDKTKIPFKLPDGWIWEKLGNILLKISDGTHHSPPNSSNGDFKYITAKNIKNEGIVLKKLTYVSKNIHDEIYNRCNVEKGDILYIKDGATTGIATINNLEEPFSMLSSVALFKLPTEIDNIYLLNVLRSSFFYNQIRDDMTGVAITRVTLKRLKESLVPIPPQAEQIRLGKILDHINKILIDSKDKVDKSLEKFNDIPNSILEKAFTGELVPIEEELAQKESRGFESASDLLIRILDEKKNNTIIKKKKKEKVTKKADAVITKKKKKKKIPLYNILEENRGRISAEDLFNQANFDQDSVEEFYSELRDEIRKQRIKEVRPNNKDVFLELV